MKLKFTKQLQKLFTGMLFCSMASVFFSCQKTAPVPYATPSYGSDTATRSMQGEVGSNFTPTFFTPTITYSGGNITFTGKSQYYTITLTFPATSGPNTYFFSTDPGYSASVYDGTNTYKANASDGGGSLTISSIVNGKYSGTFDIDGQDPSFNFLEINRGSFLNL
ncbi:MAG TPA: DUF6252 family protein [Bacteroidia bacterium]|jgi:hypothetical protein|nr:DUF6252 family protein [Bacteroidia bacterium]